MAILNINFIEESYKMPLAEVQKICADRMRKAGLSNKSIETAINDDDAIFKIMDDDKALANWQTYFKRESDLILYLTEFE